MAETAQEVWDRVVERARKEREMPKSNDDKDPYRMSQRVAHYERTQGSYVGDRKLSEEEADKRYARTASTAEMDRLLKQREEAKRKGYESLGEMNYYEGDQKRSRDAGVQKLAQRYTAGKGRGSTRDFNLDPSVEQYYKDDNGRKRVMLLPKMQYQTGVNQQRISNEMADRAFEAQQEQLQFENDRRLAEFEAAQRQQDFANQMAQRQFGIQEGQLTGRYRSQDVSNLLNQLGALKEQGSVAGQSTDYYSGLRSQADSIRNQLALQGYDSSKLGSNVSLQDFYKNAGQVYEPTLNARELDQRGQQFNQELGIKREQLNADNQYRQQQAAYQRQQDGILNGLRQLQFDRGIYESDRDYDLKVAEKLGSGQTDMRAETTGLRNHLNSSQASLEKALIEQGLSPDSNEFRLALYRGRDDIAARSARQITEDLNSGFYTREQAEALLDMVNSNLGTKAALGK
ncbi:hypothetical protein ACFLFF_27020 [Brevibacillus reuszeri]|uniref:hypothetical protein n=1 Tax=Brevibacillus reuszeri TaxID=54915 RepID=UPI00366BDDC0